jgi:flavin reductase (DIM6/NTAB) family NADH-FMN oxidoreductase RutF
MTTLTTVPPTIRHGRFTMKQALGPQNGVYPTPIPLVMSGTGEEASMLALAWIMPAGRKPPALAMIMGKGHHTWKLIEECGEFTVNFASSRLFREVDYAGVVSGRDHDKVSESGLTLVESTIVGPPMIAECPYNHECRLMAEYDLPTGSHMVIGEVVQSHADEDVLNAEGTRVDIALMDPLVYATGNREYFRLGERLEAAYSCGKDLVEK